MAESQSPLSAKVPRFAPPPTDTPVARVRDVIVCVTGDSDISLEEFKAHPPIASPIELRLGGSADPVSLGRGVMLGRLSNEDAELVMNACSSRGHYFNPIRQFGQRFSFIRNVDLARWEQQRSAWDDEGVIYDCLSLSRLVRDNAYSTEYAARIIDHEDGVQQVIYTPNAESKHAYRFRRGRDWPDHAEAAELRHLAQAYWSCAEELPARIRRAMWRTEYSAWVRWADLALPIIVSGLESLIKTERYGATAQFTQRVPALAAELGVDGVTAGRSEEVYDARSEWVHGTHVKLFTVGMQAQQRQAQGPTTALESEAFATVALFQDVLRGAIRRALLDPDFRAIFEDDSTVRRRWPLKKP